MKMGIFDKFLDAVRLNDDYDDEDDGYFDDEDDFEEVDEKPKKKLFGRQSKKVEPADDYDDEDDEDSFDSDTSFSSSSSAKTAPKKTVSSSQSRYTAPAARTSASQKITPMRRSHSTGAASMEVCVIKPSKVEDYREIADTLLSGCTVVLNLEGIDVELAQRIIDFSSGSCYAIAGGLQKVSSYIFILTPSNVEISGDIQDLLGDSMPSVSSAYL